jgi:hypothetical protein
LKPSSISLFAVAAMFAATMCIGAQAPQSPAPPAANPHREHSHPAPTNLKVLPKNLTGDQVHDMMHDWEAELGVTCRTCHVENPKDIGPNGRPRMNYADDSKQEKASARIMFTMVENINQNYVSKIEDSGLPVTCGTCHQGHLNPEPFAIEDHPRPAQVPPPAGQKPPTPR